MKENKLGENNNQEAPSENTITIKKNKTDGNITSEPVFLFSKANENKDNIIIYLVVQYYPFWATFNYTNKLSSFVSEGNTKLAPEKYKHNIFLV